MKLIVVLLISCLGSLAHAWTIDANFDSGTLGEKADGGGDGFHGSGGMSLYSDTEKLKGQSAQLSINGGETGYGNWGGEFTFPENVIKGETVWYLVHTFFPTTFDHYSYGEGNRLKFLRIHTKTETGDHIGYVDLLVDMKDDPTPYKWIYEGQNHWREVGVYSDLIVKGVWESYQMAVTFGDIPKDSGGVSEVKFWKNGKLIGHITDARTMNSPTDLVDRALLFTYWNGGSPKTQSMYVDEVKITNEAPSTVDSNGYSYLPSVNSNKPKLGTVTRD